MKPSEFGGSDTKTGVQPAPHIPTPSERLSLLYRTGDESGLTPPDTGEVFTGLVPLEVSLKRHEARGDFVHGEEWDRLTQEADAALQELVAEEPE